LPDACSHFDIQNEIKNFELNPHNANGYLGI